MEGVNDSWLSGLPRENGEKTILVKLYGKRGHSPMFGVVIDWATNLIKRKNAFVNLCEFRWDYKKFFLYPNCV